MLVCPLCGACKWTLSYRDALDPARDRFVCHSCHSTFKRYDPPRQNNVALLAAAPDLLASLTGLLGCPDLNLDELDDLTIAAIERARLAIAKAHGN